MWFLISTLHEIIPKSWEVETRKNNVGAENQWAFRINGMPVGSIEIMSNNSESKVFEGSSLCVVAWDEPPPRVNRIASVRGLTDNNGIELFAMTLLSQAWVSQEVIEKLDEEGFPDPTVFNVVADIYSNVGFGISKEGVDQFSKSLTADEKQIRLLGIPAYKSNLVCPINREKHIVDKFKIPIDWPVWVSIDPHPRKPHAISFWTTSPQNLHYIFHEISEHLTPLQIAQEIIRVMKEQQLRIMRVIIDPAAKSDGNNEQTAYDIISAELGRFGLWLEVGGKHKDSGIQILNSMLRPVNREQPQLFIFRNCRNTILQLEGWMYEINEEGQSKPSKKLDDFPECIYRIALLDPQYTPPYNEKDEVPVNTRGRSSLTGY